VIDHEGGKWAVEGTKPDLENFWESLNESGEKNRKKKEGGVTERNGKKRVGRVQSLANYPPLKKKREKKRPTKPRQGQKKAVS